MNIYDEYLIKEINCL